MDFNRFFPKACWQAGLLYFSRSLPSISSSLALSAG
jgi:hypothetical protein